MDLTLIAGGLAIIKAASDALAAHQAGTATDEQLNLLRAGTEGKIDAAIASIDAALKQQGVQQA